MQLLIEINNALGPWLSEFCSAAFMVCAAALVITWIKYKHIDAPIVLVYLMLLWVVGNNPDIWLSPFPMALIHLLLYTVFWLMLLSLTRTTYTDSLLTLGGGMAFVDTMFYLTGWPIQYHVWIIDLIFLLMLGFSFYACYTAHENSGRLGHAPNPHMYKTGLRV